MTLELNLSTSGSSINCVAIILNIVVGIVARFDCEDVLCLRLGSRWREKAALIHQVQCSSLVRNIESQCRFFRPIDLIDLWVPVRRCLKAPTDLESWSFQTTT
jgi:hypothetical protein